MRDAFDQSPDSGDTTTAGRKILRAAL